MGQLKKVAICIGHNRNTGARAHDGADEWAWNEVIAEKLACILRSRGIEGVIFCRDKALGYTAAMKKHAANIKAWGADLALELHFNSADSQQAAGCEFLHWWGSKNSKKFALNMAEALKISTVKRGDRGARSLWYFAKNRDKAEMGRGAAFCYFTHCPAVICEPCFASNPAEWRTFAQSQSLIACYYADGICETLNQLGE